MNLDHLYFTIIELKNEKFGVSFKIQQINMVSGGITLILLDASLHTYITLH